MLKRLRYKIYLIIEASHPEYTATRVFDWVMVSLIILNVAAVILETEASIQADYGHALKVFEAVSVVIFTIEYVLRLWVAIEHKPVARHGAFLGRVRFAMSPYLLIDLLAIAPVYLALLVPVIDLRVLRIFRLLRLLKLARYSPALNAITRVVVAERRALGAALIVMMGLLILCSTIVFHVETHVQPEKFSSIPAAMWWGLATLTTVGYGDVVPVTPVGKLLGGAMMIFGLGMFAIPIGIVASAFSRDIHQRDFVVTFGMVSRVPAFQHLSPVELEHIIRMLQSRRAPAGTCIISKGEIGDAMYFILNGTVSVEMASRTVELSEGDFFGEMSLYKDTPRNASVYCVTDCRFVMLSKDDFSALQRSDASFSEKVISIIKDRERMHLEDRDPSA